MRWIHIWLIGSAGVQLCGCGSSNSAGNTEASVNTGGASVVSTGGSAAATGGASQAATAGRSGGPAGSAVAGGGGGQSQLSTGGKGGSSSTPQGGMTGSGGTSSSTGGNSGVAGTTGGLTGTGGSKATGGLAATGGSKATGGLTATGGTQATGGFSATGGVAAGGAGAAGGGSGHPSNDDTSPATNFGIDAAHTNAQPNAIIASPLAKRWSLKFTGQVSYSLIADGKVYVAAAESQPNVRAVDLASGATVWGPLAIGSSVHIAYDQGLIYTGDSNGNVSALNASTGARVWATQLQGQYDFGPPPVATNGWVYVNGMGGGGTTYGVDGATGTVKWTAGTFDGSDGTVAIADGVVYEAEACDQLSAFDAITGVRKWFHSGNCTGGGGSTPGVYSGQIWVRDWAEGNIIIDTNGNAAGSFAADTLPSFDGGNVYLMRTHALTAIDVQSSTIRWSFAGDSQLCSSAAIAGAGRQVYVGSASGMVYELDESTGTQISSDNVGSAVVCGTESQALAIGFGRLLVSSANTLTAY